MKTNPYYTRVIPRDLFNEAKLLKCVGRLVLAVLDRNAPEFLTHDEPGAPFIIGQSEADGSLTITNLEIRINGEPFTFATAYNSKASYPLFVTDEDDNEVMVFNEKGEFTADFTNFCATWSHRTPGDTRPDKIAFWVSQFTPRTKKWRSETRKRLRNGSNHFDTERDRAEKLAALKQIDG